MLPNFSYLPPDPSDIVPKRASGARSAGAFPRTKARTLNLVFLGIVLAIIGITAGSGYLVHEAQVRRHAASLLDRTRQAETKQDLKKAQQWLGQYLKLRPEDGPSWKWYAHLADERDAYRQRPGQVYLAYEQALRYNPADLELERRCADLAVEMNRFADAERHLKNLLEHASDECCWAGSEASMWPSSRICSVNAPTA